MIFPKCAYTPPAWYWRLSIKWRQRYCRWYIHKWEALYAFFTNVMTKETLFQRIPHALDFTLYCLRRDRQDGRRLRESAVYLRGYWTNCWWHWMHPLPKEVR